MAYVHFEFFSTSLMRTIPVTAILPVDNTDFTQEKKPMQKPFKTLYLLHGIFGNCMDWLSGTNIQTLASKHNIAVIMPSGDNHFYVNSPAAGFQYGDFIGDELVDITRKLFHLSDKREDTFIGGLSMGGYGALVNGLKHHNTFGYIAMLSAALILDNIASSSDAMPSITHNKSYFQAVFGDLDAITGSDKDYHALMEHLIHDNVEIPQIYMTIGTEDFLLDSNRSYRDFLLKHNIPLTYVESAGAHDWDFWGRTINDVIHWLLG